MENPYTLFKNDRRSGMSVEELEQKHAALFTFTPEDEELLKTDGAGADAETFRRLKNRKTFSDAWNVYKNQNAQFAEQEAQESQKLLYGKLNLAVNDYREAQESMSLRDRARHGRLMLNLFARLQGIEFTDGREELIYNVVTGDDRAVADFVGFADRMSEMFTSIYEAKATAAEFAKVLGATDAEKRAFAESDSGRALVRKRPSYDKQGFTQDGLPYGWNEEQYNADLEKWQRPVSDEEVALAHEKRIADAFQKQKYLSWNYIRDNTSADVLKAGFRIAYLAGGATNWDERFDGVLQGLKTDEEREQALWLAQTLTPHKDGFWTAVVNKTWEAWGDLGHGMWRFWRESSDLMNDKLEVARYVKDRGGEAFLDGEVSEEDMRFMREHLGENLSDDGVKAAAKEALAFEKENESELYWMEKIRNAKRFQGDEGVIIDGIVQFNQFAPLIALSIASAGTASAVAGVAGATAGAITSGTLATAQVAATAMSLGGMEMADLHLKGISAEKRFIAGTAYGLTSALLESLQARIMAAPSRAVKNFLTGETIRNAGSKEILNELVAKLSKETLTKELAAKTIRRVVKEVGKEYIVDTASETFIEAVDIVMQQSIREIVADAGDEAEFWEQVKGLASMPVVGAMGKLTSASVAGISKVKHPRAMFDLRKLYQDYAIADAYAEQITELKKSGVSGEVLEQWAEAKTPEAREQFFIDYENDPRIEKKDPGLREKLEAFDKVRGIALAQIKDTIEQTDKNLRMELENLDVESVSGADSKIDQEITKKSESASEVQESANSGTSTPVLDEKKDTVETKDSIVKENLTVETEWEYDEKNPRHWKAYSPNGAPIYGEWKVVDARNVKFRDAESEDEREFQGRDRKTLNSQAQVFKIADELKPELLSADNYADRGAPIYNAQGNPVAGNGRTLAVQTAYGLLPNASARALENGKAYRAFVEKFAKENGVEISEDAKEFPLLVREFHQSELTEGEIAKDTNRDVKAEYSRAEAANENSEYFGRFVKYWNPGTNGDPRVEQNREFMQKFFRAIGKESSGAIIDGATGQYTGHAAEIVNDAALAWVIGDVSLTSQLFKNRLFFGGAFSGLYSMAYRLAPLRGTQYDLRNPLQSALKNFAALKRSREKLPAGKVMTWEEFKNQSEFGFVEESKLTAEEEASADILVQLFDDYSDRRYSGVARVLSSYANVADAFNGGEADLIGGGANPLPSSLLRHADAALRGNKLPDDGNTFFGSLYDRDITKEQKTGRPELKNPATMFQSGGNARQIDEADTQLVLDAVKNVFPEGVNVRVVDDVKAAIASAREWRTQNAIFNSELEAFKAGTHKGVLHLGVPGAILRASGLNATEITIKESVLRKHLKKHGISVEDVRNLPEALNNPLMVYEWGTKARSLIVITNFTLSDGRKITAAVKLERSGKSVEVNELSSVHGKSIERLLEEAVEKEPDFGKNKLKYVDKDKATEWLSLASAPLAVARQSAQRLRLIEIIENFENPSTEIREQRAFHGSPHNFAAEENAPLGRFRDNKMGSGEGAQAFGWGHYLTNVEKIARKQYAERLSNSVYATGERILSLIPSYEKAFDDSKYDSVIYETIGEVIEEIAYGVTQDPNISLSDIVSTPLKKIDETLSLRDWDDDSIQLLKKIKEEVMALPKHFERPRRHLYTAEFDDATLLDWTKPLTEEQLGAFQDRLRGMSDEAFKAWTEFRNRQNDASVNAGLGEYLQKPEDIHAFAKKSGNAETVSKALFAAGFIGHKFPAASNGAGDYSKGTNYVIYDESALNIVDKVSWLKTARGKVFGAYNSMTKEVFIAKNARIDTVLHELGWHAMFDWASSNVPEFHAKMREYAANAPEAIKSQVRKAYPDLNEQSEAFLDEVGAHAFSLDHYGKIEDLLKTAKDKTWWGRVKRLFQKIWKAFSKALGKDRVDLSALSKMDYKDAIAQWAEDFVNGKRLQSPVDGSGTGNGGMREQFIGERGAAEMDAATDPLTWELLGTQSRMQNLNIAREMEAAGKGRAEILHATGWYRGKDKKWRREIDDGKLRDDYIGMASTPLKYLYDAPELYKAYPELKDIQVHFEEISANAEVRFNGDAWEIAIRRGLPKELIAKSLVHEVQHLIQEKEGFSRGGNPDTHNPDAIATLGRRIEDAKNSIAELRKEVAKIEKEEIDPINEKMSAWREAHGEDADPNTDAEFRKLNEAYEVATDVRDMFLEEISDLEKSIDDNAEKIRGGFSRLGISGYRRLAGEVEARNVSRRLDDKHASPWNTEDVAEEEQIVLQNLLDKAESRIAEDSSEVARIEAEAKANGTWLKAPNGKPSKLNPRQWVQVRTKAFKEWFGDWENVAKKKQLNSLVVAEVAKGSFKPVAGKTPIESAVDWAEAHKEEVETVIGKVLFDGKSTKQSFSHTRYQNKYDVLPAVPKILRYGVYLGAMPDKDGATILNHYFCGRVKIGEAEHIVFVRARDAQGGSGRFYVHEVFTEEEIKKSDGKFKQGEAMQTPPAKTNPSDLYRSIIYPVLSVNEKDASKVVDENGEPLVVYHGSRTGGHFYEFANNSFFSDDFDTADMFKREADFDLYVNGKVVGTVGDEDAEFLANEISDGDYTPEDISDWGDISREDISSSDAIDEVRRLSGYEVSEDEIETVRLVPTRGVFDVFLNIRNPLVVDYGGKVWMNNNFLPEDKIKEARKKKEHDGVVVKNIVEGGFTGEYRGGGEPRPSTDYIPFSPSQIKSATDNAGTFDASNPDIRYQQEEPEEVSPAERQFEAEKAAGVKYLHWTAKKRVQQGAMALAWKLMTLGRQMPNLDDVRAVYPYETNGFVLRETRNVAKAYMEIIKARGKDISKMSLIEAEPVLVAAAKEFHGRETREKIRNIAAVDGEAVYTAIESVARENLRGARGDRSKARGLTKDDLKKAGINVYSDLLYSGAADANDNVSSKPKTEIRRNERTGEFYELPLDDSADKKAAQGNDDDKEVAGNGGEKTFDGEKEKPTTQWVNPKMVHKKTPQEIVDGILFEVRKSLFGGKARLPKGRLERADYMKAARLTLQQSLGGSVYDLVAAKDRQKSERHLQRMRSAQTMDELVKEAVLCAESVRDGAIRSTRIDIARDVFAELKNFSRLKERSLEQNRMRTGLSEVFLYSANKALRGNDKETLQEIENLRSIAESKDEKISPERRERAATEADGLSLTLGFSKKSLVEMQNVLNKIVEVKESGKAELQKKIEKRNAEMDRDVATLTRSIASVKRKSKSWLRENVGESVRSFYSVRQRLYDLTRYDKNPEAARAVIDKFSRDLSRAMGRKENIMQATRFKLYDAMEKSFGMLAQAAAAKLSVLHKEFAKFSMNGAEALSLDQLINIYLQIRQKDYARALSEPDMQFDPDRLEILKKRVAMIPEIEKAIGDDGIAYANALCELKSDILPELQKAYAEETGFGFVEPDEEFYFPLRRDYGSGAEIRAGGGNVLSALPKQYTARTISDLDIVEDDSATRVLLHTQSADAHFIAYHKPFAFARKMFGDKAFVNAVKKHSGTSNDREVSKELDGLSKHLYDVFSPSGPETNKAFDNALVDALSSATATVALGMNPLTTIRNVPAIVNYLRELDLNYLRELDFKDNPVGIVESLRDMMSDPAFKSRWGNFQDEELQKIMNTKMVKGEEARIARGVLKKIALWYMSNNQAGDSIAVLLIGQGLYRALRQKYIKEGADAETAKRKALDEVIYLTEQTQLTRDVQNKSSFARRAGKLGQVVGMFTREAQGMFAANAQALTDFIANPTREKWNKLVRTWTATAVNAFLFGFIAELFRAAVGDDEEELFDEESRKRMYLSMLGSVSSGWILFGGMIYSLFDSNPYKTNALPGTSVITNIGRGSRKALRAWEESDNAGEGVADALDEFAEVMIPVYRIYDKAFNKDDSI